MCSWFTYASMLRIYKHYAFNLQDSNAGNIIDKMCVCFYCVYLATKVMSFSSYPAYLSSLDDFYLMDRYDTSVVSHDAMCYILCIVQWFGDATDHQWCLQSFDIFTGYSRCTTGLAEGTHCQLVGDKW